MDNLQTVPCGRLYLQGNKLTMTDVVILFKTKKATWFSIGHFFYSLDMFSLFFEIQQITTSECRKITVLS